jgi:hypothetical protein
MIFDNTLLFSSQQAITATAASTNVIDLGATGTPIGGVALTRDIGVGKEMDLSVLVTENFNNLTSLTVAVQTSPDNSTYTTVLQSPAILLAALVAGYQFKVPNSFELGTNARYVRLNYTVAGTAPTTGKITAGVVSARQTNSAVGVAV